MNQLKKCLVIIFLTNFINEINGYGNSENIWNQKSMRPWSSTIENVGYIYIDGDLSKQLVMAEPHTLQPISTANITIRTNLVPLHFDLVFTWNLNPIDDTQFSTCEGFGLIKRLTDSTVIKISTRDTKYMHLQRDVFFFNLDRITTNFLNSTWRYFINSSADSLPSKLLPSNYPFGLFEFDKSLVRNFTISRYSKSSLTDKLIIERKYGRAYRVLISYDEIELIGATRVSSTKYLEFYSNESSKFINFTSVFRQETTNNLMAKYPRRFILNLTSAFILDGVPEIKVDDSNVIIATDILPKIGKRSQIFITIIDDKSFVEFTDNSIDMTIRSEPGQAKTLSLTLIRSTLSSLTQAISVLYTISPLEPAMANGEMFHSARPYRDYSPANGRVTFLANSVVTNLTLKIYQNDDLDAISYMNKHFRIYLIDIENCNTCRLGVNTQAIVRINSTKLTFRNLISFNNIMDNRLNIKLPVYQEGSIGPITESTFICANNLTTIPVKVDVDLILLNPNPFSSIIRLTLNDSSPLDPSYSNKTMIFNSITTSNCLKLEVSAMNAVAATYCYAFKYKLRFFTSYLINLDQNVYSTVIASDSFDISLENKACTRFEIENDFLVLGEVTRPLILMNNSSASYNDSEKAILAVQMDDLIDNKDGNEIVVSIPFRIKENKAKIDSFLLSYKVDIDSRLNKYLLVNNSTDSSSKIVFMNVTNGENLKFIRFSLVRLKYFPYYYLHVNLTIYNHQSRTFQLENSKYKAFSTENQPYPGSLSYSFEFTTKSLNDEKLCGVISFSERLTKFALVNFQRQLLITLFNNYFDPDCVINFMYTINKTNSSPNQLSSNNLYDYIENNAENFFFVFSSFTALNQKEIAIKENFYLDSSDRFSINVTMVSSAVPNYSVYLKSVNEEFITVASSKEVNNGLARVDSNINFYLNHTNPFDLSSYETSCVVNFNRQGTYGKAQGYYQLFLIDPVMGAINEIKYDQLDSNETLLDLMLLSEGEQSRTIEWNLRQVFNNRIFGDLILIGNVCYFNMINMRVNCSKQNEQTFVEPDGIFQFNKSSTNHELIYYDNDVFLNGLNTSAQADGSAFFIALLVERYFGSRSNANLNYAISSLNSFPDLYFPDFDTTSIKYVTFNIAIHQKPIRLNVNSVYSNANKRDFYIHLQGVDVLNGFDNKTCYGSSKIAKTNNIAKVSISSSDSFLNVIAFNQNYLMIPLPSNQSSISVKLIVYRVGQSKSNSANTYECTLKSSGYGEFLPNYIRAFNDDKLANLALPNREYSSIDQTIKFNDGQYTLDLALNLFSNFSADYDKTNSIVSKIFYLYLSNPMNGAKLIEPSNSYSYSPYIKIEFRKIPLELMNFNKETLKVGFYKSNAFDYMNQTLFLDMIRNSSLNIFNFVYFLESDRYVTNNPSISNAYSVQWIAEIVTLNDNGTKSEEIVSIRDILRCAYYDSYTTNDTELSQRIELIRCRDYTSCSPFKQNCTMPMALKLNNKLYSDCLLKIQLLPNKNAIHNLDFLDVQINSNYNTAYLYLKANTVYSSSVSFDFNSIVSFNNKLKLFAELTVTRTGLTNQQLNVFYSTKEFDDIIWFLDRNIRYYAANSGYDFESTSGVLTFAPGVTQLKLRVNLRAVFVLSNQLGPALSPVISTSSGDNTASMYPRMFQVVLKSCSPDCGIVQNGSISNVTILSESLNLWRVYRQAINGDLDLNLNELVKLAQQTNYAITSTTSDLIIQTIQQSISQQVKLIETYLYSTNSSSILAQINTRRSTLLSILCNFMNGERSDLNEKIKYFSLLEDLLYTDLILDPSCSTNPNDTTLEPIEYSCGVAKFFYSCDRVDSSILNQTSYLGENFYLNVPLDNQLSNSSCLDICIIELRTTNWIPSFTSLLNKKALSLSVRPTILVNNTYKSIQQTNLNQYSVNLTNPIVIRMLFKRAVQSDRVCSLYDGDLGSWTSNYCTTTKASTYIECKCNHRSVYGLVTKYDPLYYGYNSLWFYLTTSFKIFAVLTAVITHLFCLRYYSFEACCLMQTLTANGLSQLIYLITVAVSPSIIAQEPSEYNGSCITLSLFFHYFIVSQFSWMFISTMVFYFQLSLKIKDSFTFQLCTTLVGWFLPILVVGIFYLIAALIYENSLNYSSSFIYGDVLDNSQICFIKNIWAYIGGLVGPCAFFLLLALFFYILLFSGLNKWKMNDDVYEERLNINEMFWVFGLFSLITIVNIWAGIHIRLGYLWLFIVFCVFDFLLAFYILIFYTFMRNIASIIYFEKPIYITNASINKNHLYQQQQQQQQQQKQYTNQSNKTLSFVDDISNVNNGTKNSRIINKPSTINNVDQAKNANITNSNSNNNLQNYSPFSISAAASRSNNVSNINNNDLIIKNYDGTINNNNNNNSNSKLYKVDKLNYPKNSNDVIKMDASNSLSNNNQKLNDYVIESNHRSTIRNELNDLNYLVNASESFLIVDNQRRNNYISGNTSSSNNKNRRARKESILTSPPPPRPFKQQQSASPPPPPNSQSTISLSSNDSESTITLLSSNWLYQTKQEPNKAEYYTIRHKLEANNNNHRLHPSTNATNKRKSKNYDPYSQSQTNSAFQNDDSHYEYEEYDIDENYERIRNSNNRFTTKV